MCGKATWGWDLSFFLSVTLVTQATRAIHRPHLWLWKPKVKNKALVFPAAKMIPHTGSKPENLNIQSHLSSWRGVCSLNDPLTTCNPQWFSFHTRSQGKDRSSKKGGGEGRRYLVSITLLSWRCGKIQDEMETRLADLARRLLLCLWDTQALYYPPRKIENLVALCLHWMRWGSCSTLKSYRW